MATSTTKTNKPINPRGNDQSPKGYNRAALYSGKALDFDGVNDYVSMGTQSFITASGFSFSTKLYLEDDSEHYIFSTGYNNTNSILLYSPSSSNDLVFAWYNTSSGALLSTGVNYTNDEWFDISVNYDGSILTIYKNGIEVVNESFSIPTIASGPYEIGWASPRAKSTAYLQGKVAGFKIFNTALTASQVSDLYNNPEKIVPTGVEDTALKLWLPMMEGAGTTAYDGSGNGNHGTISGATYVNGVGAPVAQSAVIDWNKATNKVTNSYDISGIISSTTGVTFNYAEAPDGTQTATRLNLANYDFNLGNIGVDGETRSIWIRATSGSGDVMTLSRYTSTYDLVTLTEEWQRVERPVNQSDIGGSLFYMVDFRHAGTTITDVLVWCPQVNVGATADPTLLTTGTAQTSPVLLPQGLTSGRDITGVNLFENVRKQGALNLDGNSWAEVHDNASLDVTTGVTAEAWVYWVSPSASKGILAKWGSSSALYAWLFQARSNSAIRLYIYDGTNYLVESSTLTEGWRHLCATYDGVTLRMYVDGQADTTTAHTGSIPSVEESVKIGAYGAVTSTTYEHDIAQPRIYNRALTAEEVQRNYDAGKNIYTNS